MGFEMGSGAFGRMEWLFALPFAVAALALAARAGLWLYRWSRDNAAPVQTQPAQVAAKRTYTGHGPSSGGMRGHAYTRYFATFQLDDAQRLELQVTGREYGQLAEGDRGTLTWQGSRYRGFARS